MCSHLATHFGEAVPGISLCVCEITYSEALCVTAHTRMLIRRRYWNSGGFIQQNSVHMWKRIRQVPMDWYKELFKFFLGNNKHSAR